MSKNRQQTVEEIIQNTALSLFVKEGLSNVSVDSILKKAKISRRTFYKYYDSKIDILQKIPNIKDMANFEDFFLTKFPRFFQLEPMSQLNFMMEGLYYFTLNPSDIDLVYFLEILQRKDLLNALNIDIAECYRKNFEFIFTLFKKCNIENPKKNTHFFLLFLDGILLNYSLFKKYSLPYTFEEWFENAWDQMRLVLDLQNKFQMKDE